MIQPDRRPALMRESARAHSVPLENEGLEFEECFTVKDRRNIASGHCIYLHWMNGENPTDSSQRRMLCMARKLRGCPLVK